MKLVDLNRSRVAAMSVVARTVCRHMKLPDGTFAVHTMVLGGSTTGKEFLTKLGVKCKDELPEGTLSFAAAEGAAETQLGLDDVVLNAIKGEGKKRKGRMRALAGTLRPRTVLTRSLQRLGSRDASFTLLRLEERLLLTAGRACARATPRQAQPRQSPSRTPRWDSSRVESIRLTLPFQTQDGEVLCGECKTGNKPGYKFCRSCGKPGASSPRQSASPPSTSPRQSTADRASQMSRASVSAAGGDTDAEKKASARAKIAAAAAAAKKPATPAPAPAAGAAGAAGEEVACPSCKTSNKV
jgi:hypothetical protein